nr:hypothetical protein [Tanacetum cinerariifolium]
MDDPNITMEEYIKRQAAKAQRRGWTFNWEIATYDKVYCDNLDFFIDFETDFLAIFYNDVLTSNHNISSKPTVSIYNAINADIDFNISFSDFDDEDYTCIYDKNLFSYKLIPVDDLKPEPINDHVEINAKLCSKNIDIKPIDSVVCISNDTTPVESNEHLETNHDKKSKLSETSNFILIIKVMSWISFHERKPLIFIIKSLYVPFGISFDPKRFYKDGVYKKRLQRPRYGSTTQRSETPIYQCLEMIIKTRGPIVHERILEFFSTLKMAEGVINLDVVGLLSVPVRIHFWEEAWGYDIWGQFVDRLVEHFGLLTEQRLQGLTVIVCDLLMINMDELVRLKIYDRLGDTKAWVSQGPERQPDAATGAPKDVEGIDVKTDPYSDTFYWFQYGISWFWDTAHPLAATPVVRTIPQRMERIEEEVHRI